jgi:predicted dehydrogenase
MPGHERDAAFRPGEVAGTGRVVVSAGVPDRRRSPGKGRFVPRYRIAVVGLEHYHVTGWVESLEQFPDRIEIVALYDPNPELGTRLAPSFHDPRLSSRLDSRYRDVPFTTDLDALIRDAQPDIALVTLPNAHAPAAIERLARAGVHLLVDKPGARTAAEAERAFGAARAAGVKAAVGLTRRYGRGWQDARAMVTSGRLGRLITAEAIFVTSSVRVRDPRNLIFDRELSGGGILHWLGVHDLDLLLWLSGEPIVEVQAMAGTIGGEPIEVEDVLSMAIRFAGGAIGTVHYAYALPRTMGDGYLALRGAGGSVKVQPDGTLDWIGPGSAQDPVMSQRSTYESPKVPGYGATAMAIIDDLMRAIEEDRDPLANGDAVIGALRVIDAAYESARTGTRVRVGT